MKSEKYYIFCISIIKSQKKNLQQFNHIIIITKKNIIVIRDPETFCFNFDKPKYVSTWNDEFELPDNSYSVSDI